MAALAILVCIVSSRLLTTFPHQPFLCQADCADRERTIYGPSGKSSLHLLTTLNFPHLCQAFMLSEHWLSSGCGAAPETRLQFLASLSVRQEFSCYVVCQEFSQAWFGILSARLDSHVHQMTHIEEPCLPTTLDVLPRRN